MEGGSKLCREKKWLDQIQMFWKIAHFLANRWDQFHMFLWDQIHIIRVGPGTFLQYQDIKISFETATNIAIIYLSSS